MTLPTRTLSNTPTEHLADHNTLHEKANAVHDIVADYGAAGDGVTDDTAAIQAAIDAAEADNGGSVFIPPTDDYYLTSSPLTVNGSDVAIEGHGFGSLIRNNTTSVLQLAPTGAVDRFLLNRVHLRANAAGAHCIEVEGVVARSMFVLNRLATGSSTSSAIHASTSGWELLANLFLDNDYNADSQNSSVSIIDLVDVLGGRCQINTFLGGRILTTSGVSAPQMRLSCQASDYMGSNTIQGLNFEGPMAGALLMEGNSGTVVRSCGIYDLTTATDDMIVIGKHASGEASRFVKIVDTLRHGGDISTFYDIVNEGGAIATIIDNSGANTGGKINMGSLRATVRDPQGTVDNMGATGGFITEGTPGRQRLRMEGISILPNAGSPEGAVTAPVGSFCLDTSNGVAYIKASGSGNTGWAALATA